MRQTNDILRLSKRKPAQLRILHCRMHRNDFDKVSSCKLKSNTSHTHALPALSVVTGVTFPSVSRAKRLSMSLAAIINKNDGGTETKSG